MTSVVKAGVVVGLLASFLWIGASSAQKAQDQGQQPATARKTVAGLVRDIACPIQNKQATATRFNLECAKQCAKNGSPLVILTNDGTMYFPISESMPDTDQRERLLPFVGKYVTATGEVYERAGTRAIVIREINEDKNIRLTTD